MDGLEGSKAAFADEGLGGGFAQAANIFKAEAEGKFGTGRNSRVPIADWRLKICMSCLHRQLEIGSRNTRARLVIGSDFLPGRLANRGWQRVDGYCFSGRTAEAGSCYKPID